VTKEELSATDSPSPSSSTEVTDGQEEAVEEQIVQEIKDEISEEELPLDIEDKDLFNRMMEVGVFYGRSKSKTNPLTKKFIAANRSGFEIIDLQKSITHLKKACEAIEKVVANKGSILFVGTSPASKKVLRKVAEELESPYVTERWLGGTLTNFKTITDRINHFKKLKEDRSAGKLEKYTKKERVKLDKELVKLERLFGGIEFLDRMPSMMFIADITENKHAANEARKKGIPITALINTDANPNFVDYPIPANDRNLKSTELVMEYIKQAVEDGKKKALVIESENKLKAEKEAAEEASKKSSEVKK